MMEPCFTVAPERAMEGGGRVSERKVMLEKTIGRSEYGNADQIQYTVYNSLCVHLKST